MAAAVVVPVAAIAVPVAAPAVGNLKANALIEAACGVGAAGALTEAQKAVLRELYGV